MSAKTRIPLRMFLVSSFGEGFMSKARCGRKRRTWREMPTASTMPKKEK